MTLVIVALVSVALFLLVLLPLTTILLRAFSADGTAVLGSLFSSRTNRTIMQNTVVLGLVVFLGVFQALGTIELAIDARTAGALRTVVGALSGREQVRVDFVDVDRRPRRH